MPQNPNLMPGLMPCDYCQGARVLNVGTQQQPVYQACPICGGTGVQPDPGLAFTYEITMALTDQVVHQFQKSILDHPFRWMMTTGTSTGAYTLQVLDGASQRPFNDVLTHNVNIVGTGQNPAPLLTPFVFSKQGQIQVNVQDVSGSNNTIYLCFIGVELDNA